MKQCKGAWVDRALKLFFSNSIFLALNGALVFVFASVLYDTEISSSLLVASFLITFAVYTLNLVTDSKEDAINRSIPGRKTKAYLVLSICSTIVSLVIGALISVYAFFVLFLPLIIGFIYSVKLAKSLPRLKEIVGIKSIVVAFSWGITGAFLPATMDDPIPLYKEVLVFLYIFAQILVNTIIFDTLDVKGDHASGIRTIPLALGIMKTRILLLSINASFIGWLLACLFSGVFLEYLFTLAVGVVYETLIIFYFLKASRPRLHAELFVDGEWVYLVLLMRAVRM